MVVYNSIDELCLDGYQAERVERCPICAGDGQYIMTVPDTVKNAELNVYTCEQCGCTYIDPKMTEESMSEYYSSGDYYGQFSQSDYYGERHRAMVRIMLIMQITTVRQPKRALDVGCGHGYLLQRIRDWSRHVETVGYDVYDYGDQVHPVIHDKNEITGDFDFITCMHVLEHTYDPLEELAWMWSLLRKGGTLVLELPVIRKIMLEHPITFTKDSAHYLAQYIGCENYSIIDVPVIESCLVFMMKV